MKESTIRICGILFLLVFEYIFIFGILIYDLRSAIDIFIISAAFALTYWESSRWVVLSSISKIPGLIFTKRRILLIINYLIPLALVLPIAQMELMQFFHVIFISMHNIWNYLFYFGLNIICLAVVVVLYESIYYIQNWKSTFAESEKIKKVNLDSQNQFLKDQIKPHFLFNSLNSLTALIHTNPNRAEKFAEEMSTVYRYLLSKKESELVLLREELEFLDSYISLLRIRFGSSLVINLNINCSLDDFFIPPFALQLMIENAVKHNIVSKEQPLTVHIDHWEKHLVVTNIIQIKSKHEQSEKTGLLNLSSRYKLLKKNYDVQIINDDKVFKVILPLIAKEV